MMRTLLVRGMLAGLVSGVLASVFAYLFGEPSINAAIGLEGAGGHVHGAGAAGMHDHGAGEEELVGRGVQSTLGLFAGVGVYGVAVGGLFAVAFALAYGRLGTLRPRVTAALLAAGAFSVVVLVPFLKYPANSPAVGGPGTIGDRTELYFGFVALSLVAGIVAVVAGRGLADRVGAWIGGLLAAGGYVLVMAVLALVMPVIDEVPAGFPGSKLWDFRLASIGTQFALWTALGLTFGALAEKALAPREKAAPPALA